MKADTIWNKILISLYMGNIDHISWCTQTNHLYSTVVYAHLHQIAIKVSDERSKYLYDYEQLQTDTRLHIGL